MCIILAFHINWHCLWHWQDHMTKESKVLTDHVINAWNEHGFSFLVVRLIYGKYPLNPQKMLQKVSQLILLGFSVLYNISKVYQSRTPGKVFFSRWRPRWPPKCLNDHNYVTINTNLMILVSIPRLLGAKNTLRPLKMIRLETVMDRKKSELAQTSKTSHTSIILLKS